MALNRKKVSTTATEKIEAHLEEFGALFQSKSNIFVHFKFQLRKFSFHFLSFRKLL